MNAVKSAQTPETVVDINRCHSRSTVRSGVPVCSCASRLEQVEAAWRLVYARYTQMGLIEANAFGLHAVPTAVGSHACVIQGTVGADVAYTMTLFRDNPAGLALDSVYAPYLDELREQGRTLLEVGMLADRRQSDARGIGALFNMMRWAIHYGLHTGVTDIVIGVHPRHAQFYVRCYGFEEYAPPTSYALVKNNPVVLLRLALRETLAKDLLPRGLADASANPIPASAFANRFAFRPEQLRGSRIAGLLKDRYGMDPDIGPRQRPATPAVSRTPVEAYLDDLLLCAEA